MKNDTSVPINVFILPIALTQNGKRLSGQAYRQNTVVIDNKITTNIKNSVMHELAHLYGIEHCDTPQCLMQKTYEDVSLTAGFCSSCVAKLCN